MNNSHFSCFRKPRPASVCDCVNPPHPHLPPIIHPSHSALFSKPSARVMTSTIMAGRTGHAGSGFLKTPAIMFQSGTADFDHTAVAKMWAVLIPPPLPFIVIIIIILRFTQIPLFYRSFCTTMAQQKTSFGLSQRRFTGPGMDRRWITLPACSPRTTPRATTVRSS